MNEELILKEGQVKKPFEARTADHELKIRVEIFKKFLNQKRKAKALNRIRIRGINEHK